MKLTLKEKLRLAELKSKDAAALTADEKTELTALETKAKAAKEDIAFIVKNYAPDESMTASGNEGEDGEDEEGAEVTPEELTSIIAKAVKEAGSSNEDADKIIKAIGDKLVEHKGLSAEDIEGIVAKHSAKGLDKDSLLAALKEAIPADKGVTAKEFKKLFEDFAASMKQTRQTQFSEGAEDISFPIEHRSGNLSVAEKQLLNLCLMHVSENAKAETKARGGVIPVSLNDGISEKQLSAANQRGERMLKSLRQGRGMGLKTLTTGGVGEGAELIPVDLSSQLLARLYLESQLATELMASEVQMPTDPFKYPMTTTRPQFKVGAEAPGVDPTASNPGTQNVTLDAKKLIGMSDYSYEADEDAIVAVLDTLQAGLGSGAASAFEGALIEGDDSVTHQHSDYHAIANHHTKLFKGFRKYAIAGGITVDFGTGGINNTNIKALRKKLRKYGVKPKDLMLIAGPQAYNDLIGLDETLTFEKVGSAAAARILTGEAASIYGMRIVVSGEMREDLNASGVYDGSTVTKGGLLVVHRPSWIVGVRRGFTLEVEVDKKQQVNYVIASFRRAFQPTETPSVAQALVGLGFNATA